MQERTVVHETIVLERDLTAAPTRVFAAWASSAARGHWAAPDASWETRDEGDDFRVGGRELSYFGPKGDLRFRAETVYLNILVDRRIVMACSKSERGEPISCALDTVELLAHEGFTRMIFTEQVAFFDRRDVPASRRRGWSYMLDKLVTHIAGR